MVSVCVHVNACMINRRERERRETCVSVFFLSPLCRLHEFVWHGTDPVNKTKKVPGALKFTKLRVIPDQFYYNVDDVIITLYILCIEGVQYLHACSEKPCKYAVRLN